MPSAGRALPRSRGRAAGLWKYWPHPVVKSAKLSSARLKPRCAKRSAVSPPSAFRSNVIVVPCHSGRKEEIVFQPTRNGGVSSSTRILVTRARLEKPNSPVPPILESRTASRVHQLRMPSAVVERLVDPLGRRIDPDEVHDVSHARTPGMHRSGRASPPIRFRLRNILCLRGINAMGECDNTSVAIGFHHDRHDGRVLPFLLGAREPGEDELPGAIDSR